MLLSPIEDSVARLFATLIANPDVRKATQYINPFVVVKATRRRKPRKNARTTEVVVTYGAPNYSERVFLSRMPSLDEFGPNKIHVRRYSDKWKKKRKRKP